MTRGEPFDTRAAAAAMTCPGHTSRRLVLLAECSPRTALGMLRSVTGLRVAVSSDFATASSASCVAAGEGMLFENLGVALLGADPDRVRALEACASAGRILLEPERCVRAKEMNETFRTRTSHVVPLTDTPHAAWGLQATRVLSSRYSGRGTRVALLDTGLDFEHPDFAGRAIVSQSFVAELPVDDDNGHGTFAAGVACGPRRPLDGPRYGVACEAELYVARVLDDEARGTDGQVLAGIDWAVRNGCAVVSMSLGAPTIFGDSYPRLYEEVAARALRAGSLLIAPAGNESQRPDTIAPVEHPANCPSILAIGALDQSLEVAPFSCGGLNAEGGGVDLAAPGIAIISCSSGPGRYQTGSGTSMAAPYVAGVAALLAEANPGVRGAALRTLLLEACRALPLPAPDVGAGLVQAPQ